METHTESLWILFLTSKFNSFSYQNIVFSIFLLFSAWLGMALLCWAYPGGSAWGKVLWNRAVRTKPIPGPKGVPVFGSMSLMDSLAHRRLAAEAESLGATARRLMAFSLGDTRVIITCNVDVAREILNSSVFVDRPIKESAYNLMFDRAIGFAPYGVYWRMLRKITSAHLFCSKQIINSEEPRFEIADQMIKLIGKNMGAFSVRGVLKQASLYHMMGLIFGRKYELGSSNEEAGELSRLVEEGYELLGQLNWADHLRWVGWLDPQKIRMRSSQLLPRVNRLVNRVIAEHRDQGGARRASYDFVDVLLSLQGLAKLSDPHMVAALWEMIFRGTDTVAVLIEWILARMVLHPHIQSKVQHELDHITGKSRSLIESDTTSAVYLQAIVKEALRLHPPGPLLSWARLSTANTTVDGYDIPAGTTAMINMWAIGRDPQVWQDPLEFNPERFCTADMEGFSVLGSDLRLAPFGSGRRSCPGKILGLTTVTFWVGSLLYEYKWTTPNGEKVDLSEVLKLSCEMQNPLNVRICPRRM